MTRQAQTDSASRIEVGSPRLNAWVYTEAVSGSLLPVVPRDSRGVRFAAFLKDGLAVRGWESRRLRAEPDLSQSVLLHKAMSHRCFPRAECTLWMDASFAFAPGLDVEGLIRGFLRTDADILAFPYRGSDARKSGLAGCEIVFRRGNNRVKRFNESWAQAMRSGSCGEVVGFNHAARECDAVLKYLPAAGRVAFVRQAPRACTGDQTTTD